MIKLGISMWLTNVGENREHEREYNKSNEHCQGVLTKDATHDSMPKRQER